MDGDGGGVRPPKFQFLGIRDREFLEHTGRANKPKESEGSAKDPASAHAQHTHRYTWTAHHTNIHMQNRVVSWRE